MLKPIDGLGRDVIAFEAEGTVTAKDYADRLVPAVERVLEAGDTPRLLYVLGPSFERFELGALFADAKLGVSHLTDFDRIAVVTDHGWIDQSIRAFGALMPCPVRTFRNDELADAKAWVADVIADAFRVEVERDGSVARLHVRLHGALDTEAEDELVRAATDGIGDATEVRVLIDASAFHGWRELRALWHHIRFVAGQRRKLDRVAIVGDAKWQRRLVGSAKRVLRVDARYFSVDELDAASAWLAD